MLNSKLLETTNKYMQNSCPKWGNMSECGKMSQGKLYKDQFTLYNN